MAKTEVNSPPFLSTHPLPLLSTPRSSPPPPKRSRLSLRRTTQMLHKPCYKEDDTPDLKGDVPKVPGVDDKLSVEMIDLTQDENASPNCASTAEGRSADLPVSTDYESNEIRVPTLGLPNCGNTCYVNSILQVLRYTPDFLTSLHSLLLVKHHLYKVKFGEDETKEIVFFKHLHQLYTAMKKKEAMMKINMDKDYCYFLMKPVKLFINSLREISLLFEEGEQHDAHELLITTIAAFSTARQSLKRHIRPEDAKEEASPAEFSPSTDSEAGQTVVSDSSGEGSVPKPEKMVVEDSPDAVNPEPEVRHPIPSLSTPKRRKGKLSNFDYSVVDHLNLGFEGRIRHIVQCLECEKRLEKEESFANLEVSIPEKNSSEDSVDLRQCLSQTTILCGENKYFCGDCQHYNEAKMSSEVIQSPPILLLHFNWMKSCEESNVDQTSVKILIPRTFETSESSEVFCCPQQLVYKLFAVVLHIGRSTEGGHYVSFVRDATLEDEEDGLEEDKNFLPKLRSTAQFVTEPERCCTTKEIANFKSLDATTRWLLFDDNVVSPVVVDEEPQTFPYFNYLSLTASPCMIFYHQT